LRDEMRYNVQYFHFIRRGAVRIQAVSDLPQVL